MVRLDKTVNAPVRVKKADVLEFWKHLPAPLFF